MQRIRSQQFVVGYELSNLTDDICILLLFPWVPFGLKSFELKVRNAKASYLIKGQTRLLQIGLEIPRSDFVLPAMIFSVVLLLI